VLHKVKQFVSLFVLISPLTVNNTLHLVFGATAPSGPGPPHSRGF